ncbi:MAG: ThiF family adenylyltransferase [Planctomycetota bacterium]
MERTVVVGLGGIGGALVEPLARYLTYSKSAKELWLVDGDIFERKNGERQRMLETDAGRHKADVWGERIQKAFPDLFARSFSSYLTPQNIRDILPSGSAVLLAVDNHATRNLVQCHASKLRDVVLISGGNDFSDGNVQVFAKRRGRALLPPITNHHPEIEFPEDRRPDEIGCDEMVFNSPQLLFANLTAAVVMLNTFYAFAKGSEPAYAEAYFDVMKNRVRPVVRT